MMVPCAHCQQVAECATLNGNPCCGYQPCWDWCIGNPTAEVAAKLFKGRISKVLVNPTQAEIDAMKAEWGLATDD
jgi:hypothetical protein